jgi:hypothetical protein
MKTPTRVATIFMLTVCAVISGDCCFGQAIELDASRTLNAHADQVGIWVNTNTDRNDEALANVLRGLKLKSIRYGWQCGLIDRDDLSSQVHSPRDRGFNGYLANEKSGRMWENFGPEGIVDLMKKTNTVGFAVLSTDGINYIGKSDQMIAGMTRDERIEFYAKQAAQWASWAKANPFEYFEIGNENDLSGGEHTKTAIAPWDPAEYAAVARKFLTEIKRANPEAKCGINGGLLKPELNSRWFDAIAAAEPSLATDLSFLVAHRYEMWLDETNWMKHHDWDFGRLSEDFRKSHAKHFAKLPIHVTEIGPWKSGENDPHYRALLATEMLGNIRMDSAVQHVQFWPTRWSKEGGIFNAESQLTPMGLGLATYTRFAQPNMFAVGYSGHVRYFAAKGDAGVTYWFVNHGKNATNISCRTNHVSLQQVDRNEVWSLESPTRKATASDTVLRKKNSVNALSSGHQLTFQIAVEPFSVTVVAFGEQQ